MSKLKCIVMSFVTGDRHALHGWDLELAIHSEGLLQDFLGCANDSPIVGSLLCGQVKM